MTVDEDIKRAVECMRKGGVILYPTDTVWGIGCDDRLCVGALSHGRLDI